MVKKEYWQNFLFLEFVEPYFLGKKKFGKGMPTLPFTYGSVNHLL